jgi:hypothetical protein
MRPRALSVRCECHRLAMRDVGVICAHAASPRKLEKELARLLAGQAADEVLGVSHWTATVSTKQSGGIWSSARQAHKLEYSAVVLVRTH